jgi:hypothetical protein
LLGGRIRWKLGKEEDMWGAGALQREIMHGGRVGWDETTDDTCVRIRYRPVGCKCNIVPC